MFRKAVEDVASFVENTGKKERKQFGIDSLNYETTLLKSKLTTLERAAWNLKLDEKKKHLKILNSVHIVKELSSHLKENKNNLLAELKTLLELSQALNESPDMVKLKIPKVPGEIRLEITADYKELEKCINSGCYRSSVIICGRILETVLHRRYFEATGIDLLEKSPGIGLGNLIAKMRDKNIQLDPGITQQIHLVNQVRIFSVHKKQQPFTPSQKQTEAIILYTTDLVEKVFENGNNT